MFQIFTFDELPSTNDYLKQAYQAYPDQSVIVARKQTNGRGRFDRVWESTDDLTFSLCFHKSYQQLFLAPLAVVLALREHHIDACIKWPNDVWVNAHKVCGILIEKVFDGSHFVAEIVGIGVNVCEKDIVKQAGYVPLTSMELLTSILQAYERLIKTSSGEILTMYRTYNMLVGRTILHDQKEYIVQDVHEDGYLIVQCGEDIEYLKSEEISFHDQQWQLSLPLK